MELVTIINGKVLNGRVKGENPFTYTLDNGSVVPKNVKSIMLDGLSLYILKNIRNEKKKLEFIKPYFA